jgi:hypothetical protein
MSNARLKALSVRRVPRAPNRRQRIARPPGTPSGAKDAEPSSLDAPIQFGNDAVVEAPSFLSDAEIYWRLHHPQRRAHCRRPQERS